MKINPILNKELKLGSRSMKLSMLLLLYDGILALVALTVLKITEQSFHQYGNSVYASLLPIFTAIVWIQYVLVEFLVPILTASSISGERERQTLDIMLTTPIKSISIITGKLISSIATIFTLVISSLPIIGIAFIFGGININNILLFLLVILVVAILAGSIGIFFSTVTKKTTSAVILTFLVLMILIAGTFILCAVVYLSKQYSLMNQPNYTGTAPSMGSLPLILLANPVMTFYEFASSAMNGTNVAALLNGMYQIPQKSKMFIFMDQYWLPASIVVQLGISLIFISLSAKIIDPLRKKTKKRAGKRAVNGETN